MSPTVLSQNANIGADHFIQMRWNRNWDMHFSQNRRRLHAQLIHQMLGGNSPSGSERRRLPRLQLGRSLSSPQHAWLRAQLHEPVRAAARSKSRDTKIRIRFLSCRCIETGGSTKLIDPKPYASGGGDGVYMEPLRGGERDREIGGVSQSQPARKGSAAVAGVVRKSFSDDKSGERGRNELDCARSEAESRVREFRCKEAVGGEGIRGGEGEFHGDKSSVEGGKCWGFQV